mgnify:CR=1 FL=1
MMNINKKIIVALDNYSIQMTEEIMSHWKDKVYGFKLNHTLYPYVHKQDYNIFCDYKLFDIPNTMCHVIEHLIDTGANIVTVHMANNDKALDVLSKYVDKIKIVGVSLLTSWEDVDCLWKFGLKPEQLYEHTVIEMERRGFWGMICSPQELTLPVVQNSKIKKICPGIRYDINDTQDQIRVATPEKALADGADYLVMGRSFFN